MSVKQKLSVFSIVVMNLGFLGINFAWGLEFANMSSIYERLGANPDQIPILWLAGPITGLVVQPIVGYWSDNVNTRIGRRKPFFLAGAIVSFVGLILMPYCTALWMAALLLWILDAAVNVSMGPYRAYLADTINDEQMTLGYSIQTILMSVGTIIASIMPFVLINLFGSKMASSSDSSVGNSFIMGAVVLLITIILAVVFGKTEPNDEPAAITACKREKRSFSSMFYDIFHMPSIMKQLSVVQFFAWMGYFCIVMYFPITVANRVFHAQVGSSEYNAGIAWAGLCFSISAVFCLISCFLIPLICKFISRKALFIIMLAMGAVGMFGVYFAQTKYDLIWCTIGIGVTYAGILTMPYTILGDKLPKEKMGIYMGLFNLFICLPQMVLAIFFGFIMQYIFNDQRVFGVVSGGVFLLIAVIFAFRVNEKSEPVK